MDLKLKDGPDFPKQLDNNDQLGHFRQRFYLNEDIIYMCGNSLGLASEDAERSVLDILDKWKREGVNLWHIEENKYHLYTNHLAKLMAPLLGVDDDEIVFVGSTTANIHQAISTLYKPSKSRYKILVDDLNFPTDRYAVDSQVKLKGYEVKDAVKVVKSRDGKFILEEDVIEAMTEDVFLILLPTVLYRSAQVLDMERISKEANNRGILIGWDLSHGIGAIEMNLKPLNVDFAVWCNYKYINGGPGAVAGLYLNRKHFGKVPGLAGWHGNKHETQFLLRQEFEHQQDASGWQIGTPSLLSMATLEGSLRIYNEAGMRAIRQKSLHITAYLMFLIENHLQKYGFAVGNLREDSKRGGHVCLEHDEAQRISTALRSRGVVPDFRIPNTIRLTPTALYSSYEEVFRVVMILKDIMERESYKMFSGNRDLVV